MFETICLKLIYWFAWQGDMHLREFAIDALRSLLPWEIVTWSEMKSLSIYVLQNKISSSNIKKSQHKPLYEL